MRAPERMRASVGGVTDTDVYISEISPSAFLLWARDQVLR